LNLKPEFKTPMTLPVSLALTTPPCLVSRQAPRLAAASSKTPARPDSLHPWNRPAGRCRYSWHAPPAPETHRPRFRPGNSKPQTHPPAASRPSSRNPKRSLPHRLAAYASGSQCPRSVDFICPHLACHELCRPVDSPWPAWRFSPEYSAENCTKRGKLT
jgi:hypothetical protein